MNTYKLHIQNSLIDNFKTILMVKFLISYKEGILC